MAQTTVDEAKLVPCGHCRRCALHDDPGGCLTVEEYISQFVCGWFATCDNQADTLVSHPVLGLVPTCFRCEDFYNQQAGSRF